MRALWRRTKREEAGFTLIELAIALTILGILVAIAVPTYMSVRNRAFDSEAKQNLGEIRTLAWSYYLEKGTWAGVANLERLGLHDPHTTPNWEFLVDESRKDMIRICARPVSGAPFTDRYWSLELKDDGSASLTGPDAADCR